MTSATVAFTATAPLTRFAVRRDRVRIIVWIAAIVLLAASTIASIKGLYPTQLDLDKAAKASQNNAAAIVFNGPPLNLATVGGQVAFQMGTFGLIMMGLMSMFMLGRLTRGEEESGRSELVRSLPVGPHALPAAAMITVSAMNVVTGALVTLTLLAVGLPTAGSLAFGISFMFFGLLFTAITAVAAQITENTRVVYGIGGLVLGASFVLRAIGDVGDGTISWLSPIGWAQKMRPFAGETWWPLLIIIGATALSAWLAIDLSRRRDLGAGLVAPRLGRAHAAPSLGTPVGLAMRLQRGSIIGWTGGLLALAVAYGWITDSINEFVKDNTSLTDIIAAHGQGSLAEQYVAMSFRILALVTAGFAIQSALRTRSEETLTHAEQVLATPVSRTRFAMSHLTVAFGGSALILFLEGVTFGVIAAAASGDSGASGRAIVAGLAFVPAVWIMIGLTAAFFGIVPRASVLAWAYLGFCFVVGMFGQLLDLPHWIENLSPFQHVPSYPAGDLHALPLIALTAVAVAFTAAGVEGFRRRDIG